MNRNDLTAVPAPTPSDSSATRMAESPGAAQRIDAWSPRQVLGVWAAAALPMGLLTWVVAPALSHSVFSGPTALVQALIVCLMTGLIWQFVLVVVLVRREQGTLRWGVVKAALWLNGPISTRTHAPRRLLWWLALPLMMLLYLEELLPAIPTPRSRDLSEFFASDRGQDWMSGNWTWFALLAVLYVFNTVLGEELLFRGLLLPRMGRFGRADWLVNGALFAAYHLHVPWVIPQTLLVDTFASALPSRRWRSALFGIVVHSGQTVFFLVLGLALVLQ